MAKIVKLLIEIEDTWNSKNEYAYTRGFYNVSMA